MMKYNNFDFAKHHYCPSFFKIKLDVAIDLEDIMHLPDGTLSLFFHEYLHFIQDISTKYGLMNIANIYYYIHYCAFFIISNKKNQFKVPIFVEKEAQGYNSLILNGIYRGSSISMDPKCKKIEIKRYWIKRPKSKMKNNGMVSLVKFKFIENQNTKKTFIKKFGGNLICEGMAYLAERYVFEDILVGYSQDFEGDEYPYCVVSKIAEKIYPSLAQNSLFLIAICDASLMTYHSGLSFIKLVQHLKRINFVEEGGNIEGIYKESIKILGIRLAEYKELTEFVRYNLKPNFRCNQESTNDDWGKTVKGLNNWINTILDRIKDIREKQPYFIRNSLISKNLKENISFKEFLNYLGTPFMLNGEGIGTIVLPQGFHGDKFNPGLFLAMNQMLRIFSSSKPVPCELKEYCTWSKSIDPNVVVDERCDKSPWVRSDDKFLCPMGVMWRHWGLNGYEPIYV